MYQTNNAMSVESLKSTTDSLLSFESGVPEAAGMDSIPDIEAENEELLATSKSLVHSEFCSKLVHFEVKGTLYSISDALLPGCGYMASVIDQEDPLAGTLEVNPMGLDITVSEMNNIMRVLHARQLSTPLDLTIEQWSEALHIATIWRLTAAHEYIVERITNLFPDQPPIDRIALADQCGVQEWLNPAYQTICTRADPPTMNEGVQRLGFDRLVALFTIREACRSSPPPPVVMSDTRPAWCRHCNTTQKAYGFSSTHLSCSYCGSIVPMPKPTEMDVISAEIASKMIKDSKELSWKPVEDEAITAIPTAPDIILADNSRAATVKQPSGSGSSTVQKNMKGRKECKAPGKPANTGRGSPKFHNGPQADEEAGRIVHE
ncbi:hypothetical protein FRB93_013104 [Tulasnella sp. JGI-2019a]|nr:hypothetical protein FRB93_013104 [Tulasnella sp. JGI-2019a]